MARVDLAPTPTRAPLIASHRRIPVLVVVALGLAGFTLLALAVAGMHTETGFDTTVDGWLFAHVGNWAAAITLGLSDPLLTTSILVAVAVGAALVRRWDVLAWAAVAPALAIVLAENVFKPLVGRRMLVDLTRDPYYATHRPPGGVTIVPADSYAYPSGHQTGVTAVTVELAVLLLLVTMTTRVRAALLAALALWTLVAAAGLVRNHYHFATDTVGAILLTTACVLATALAADAVVRRFVRPPPQLT